MMKHIFLYLFIFAALIALLIYSNSRTYQKHSDQLITDLKVKVDTLKSQNAALVKTNEENTLFSVENQGSVDYFYKSGLKVEEVKPLVTEALIELNFNEGGNPIIPYIGANAGYQINSMRFLNYRWIVATYTDGDTWGEIIIRYFINDDKSVDFELEDAVILP